ncbi:type III glutamate--ammonia ligase [Methyloligella sp. 2.7D]|uniref:type III glutamate--ammonia ligase n=1 Tax=unclassified Methyloligella TaxID=2625955 RepID=UPI001FF03FDD|nr:type III glutamate--ammonia ligase [Methyloligella sp. GL2]
MPPVLPKGATKAELEAAGVKFLAASFVDMHGVSKAKMVPVAHYDHMMEGSELFTGAALDGVPQEVSDEEVAAVPDPASVKVMPWKPEVAWFASDLRCEGKPFEPGSRNILKRVLAAAEEKGFGLNMGMEAEFFVLEDREDAFAPVSKRPHLEKPAYDLSRLLDNKPWFADLAGAMDALDWGLYSFDHEDGIGQVEFDFKYFPVLEMADNFVFFRMMANEIARSHGAFATFMPKPYGDRAGSGAHFNMSLYDLESGANLFASDDDPRGNHLSPLGYQFVAGMLRHLPAICAVVAPTVNSYKRLIKQGSMSGFTWAPIFRCYGNNNRTNTVRIPLEGKRVELRAADSACNPYLGAALVLAAGLEGIAEELDPGDPHTENMYLKSPAELDEIGVEMLPKTLDEALDAFETDPLAKSVFGDAMFDSWLSFKRQEWLDYMNHVSDWETARYLKFF